MNKSQIKGMLKFHRKAEKAYRKANKLEHAQRAHEMRAELLNQLKAMRWELWNAQEHTPALPKQWLNNGANSTPRPGGITGNLAENDRRNAADGSAKSPGSIPTLPPVASLN